MPLYKVKTLTREGKVEQGEFNVPDRGALQKVLEKEGRIIVTVRESENKTQDVKARGKVKVSELTDLLTYLSITVSTGIPVTTGIEDFITQTRSPMFKAILKSILEKVTRGERLSEAFGKYEKYFGTIFVNVIKAGEETGALDVVMDKLKTQLDWQIKIKSTFKQAMIYPAFLITAICGLVVLLLTFLLPRIMGIYKESSLELPAPTKIIVAASEFLRGNWILLLAVVVILPVAFITVRKFDKGRVALDKIFLGMPVFGPILAEISLARFTVIFKTMLFSGVEIVKSLEISGSSAGNGYIQGITTEAIESVKGGTSLSVALDKFKSLGFILPRMISIGEKSGKIVDALECAYRYYDQSIPKRVTRMISVVEPSVIMIAGVLVGFILVGALMPIYSMYSAL